MNINTRLTLPIVVVAAIGLFSQPQSQATEAFAQKRENSPVQMVPLYASSAFHEAEAAQDSNTRNAKPGDIASGSVLNSPAGQLYLNVRPCDGQSFIIVFHQPYSRSTRGQKNCGGQPVTIEQVQQN